MNGEAYCVLQPERVAFISYPYEWCFTALKDAAMTTLQIQAAALEAGLSLKDASAYNIQWHRGRPTLIDTLSFETYVPGRPWVAYRQFCEHFLAPLALMSTVDVRLSLLQRPMIHGIPLDLAARLLPWRTKWSLGLQLHLHTHARFQQQHAGTAATGTTETSPAASSSRGISLTAVQQMVNHLEQTVRSLKPPRGKTEWDDYYQANHNYEGAALAEKERLVRTALDASRPQSVWDLGANDGRFSRIAVAAGATAVVSWDIDPNCVDANYCKARADGTTNIFPLLMDLTNPSPAIGWAHCERSSLVDRGPVDVVMALGLIHHLAISNNLPLDYVVEFLEQCGREAIVEWVPKEDSQVRKLLATREDVFPGYQLAAFRQVFGERFEILSEQPIPGTQRTLFHGRARD